MLRETVIEALRRNFGESVEIKPDEREFAVFRAKHPEVGNVSIDVDGNELIVWIGNITHGHFGSYDPDLTDEKHEDRIAEDLVEFLSELFEDKYLLYKSRFSGGWGRPDLFSEKDFRSKRTNWFNWSGPVNSTPDQTHDA